MPGLKKVGNITLKKGVLVKDTALWDWFNTVKMNTIKRSDIGIELTDESGTVLMSWTLHNAFPAKITGTDLKSDSNEVAIETVELAYELLTVSNG